MRDAAAQRKTELAFAAYVASHSANLLRYAIKLCASRADAEDNVAETLLKLWKSWPDNHAKIREGGIAYALTAVRNTIRDQVRSRNRRPGEIELDSLEATPSQDHIDGAFLFGELQRELWATVATLPEIQQQLIYLRYVEERTISGAARQLGLSNSTADRYHKFALVTLRDLIAGPEEEHQIG